MTRARTGARVARAALFVASAVGCGATPAGEGTDAGSFGPVEGDAGYVQDAGGASPRPDAGGYDSGGTGTVTGSLDGEAPPPKPDAAGMTTSGLNPPDTYVQLFKWRWTDIATECTTFLGPNGFGAVQISPPEESITTDAWWDMYQPVGYTNLVGDMGHASDLAAMIATCHAAGVRVYADAVFNQMAGGSGTGTDGSSYDADTLQYAAFGSDSFHSDCAIQQSDYADDRNNVVNCRLTGLPDLATDTAPVQRILATYLSSLVAIGVDGFRIDAAKHMWPSDLQAILGGVPSTTSLGEPLFITQEVIPDGTVNRSDYFVNGTINEFPFTYAIRDAFRGNNGLDVSQLPALVGTGAGGGSADLEPSANVTVFVDNHDTERSRTDSLNLYDDDDGRFAIANVFVLAQPYGRVQLQSGFVFSFSDTDQNAPAASPYDGDGNPIIMGAWDFVHRWPSIAPVVAFRSAVSGEPMVNIVSGSKNHLAFGRGAKGFVAINDDAAPWTQSFQTGLPAGTYCNVVHGLLAPDGTTCASDSAEVDGAGQATLTVESLGSAAAPAVVLYANQKTR